MSKDIGQTPTAPPASSGGSPSTVQIPATQILPQDLPTLNVGDLLRFHVRANPPGEVGTLYFQGHLIKTMLPSNVHAGDKLLARLEHTGDQVVFKILELLKPDGTRTVSPENSAVRSEVRSSTQDQAPPQQNAFADLVSKIESVLDKSPQAIPPAQVSTPSLASGLQTAQTPLPFESVFPSSELRELVSELVKQIDAPQVLSNPPQTAVSLQTAAKGESALILRQSADALRAVLKDVHLQPPTADRFLALLHEQLRSVLAGAQEQGGREISLKQIDILIRAVSEELNLQKHGSSSKESDAMKLVLTDLKLAKQDVQTAEHHLENALSRVQDFASNSANQDATGRTLDSKSVHELQQLINRLDSLASTYETLAQLNPVMHALGEPAMILFPFIMQGLLQHTEISVNPDAGKKEQQQGKGRSEDLSNFQRIQIRIPLPNLGEIDIDIAHQDKEILTRFTLADSDKATFVQQRSGELRDALQAAEFTLVDVESGFRRGSNTESDSDDSIVA